MGMPRFGLFARMGNLERAVGEAPLSATDASNPALHRTTERKPDRNTTEHNMSWSGICPNCRRKTEPSSQMCWCGYRL